MHVPTESAEQIRFVGRVRHFHPGILIFAIPNGGGRNPQEATRLKEEGVLAGIPDLMIPEPRGNYNGMFIEMKRVKGGRTSQEQATMIERLRDRGYNTVVCEGCAEAWREFLNYMALPPDYPEFTGEQEL